MGSWLNILSQEWGLQPMRWQASGKLVRDMSSHLQLPRAERGELYSVLGEIIERSWLAYTRTELWICKDVGDGRIPRYRADTATGSCDHNRGANMPLDSLSLVIAMGLHASSKNAYDRKWKASQSRFVSMLCHYPMGTKLAAQKPSLFHNYL
jgi:hypothetical protein